MFPSHGRLAGIDYGHVRIGVAISDPGQIVASPLETYTRGDLDQDANHFQRLTAEEEIEGFVVGLPVHSSGEESAKSQEARRFGKWLQETTDRPVCFYDERYSTRLAEQLLSGGELRGKKRKSRLDRVAAQIILAAFLESPRSAPDGPLALDD